jgi:hypothetical protein
MEDNTTTETGTAKVLVQKSSYVGAAAVATVVGIVAFAMSIRQRGRIDSVEVDKTIN